jgi:phosphoribosylglycinamide formyltransferase-1
MLSVVVLISGTGSNLLALLKKAESPLYPARIVAVGSDVSAEGLAHADMYGIPTFVVSRSGFSNQDTWAEILAQSIDHFNPDLIVLAGFMKILPASFISKYKSRIINIHPSLLPLFPGAHGVRDALLAGVTKTGATIHVVDEGVDTGPIIAQREVIVLPEDTELLLHSRIKDQEQQLLIETIKQIAEGSLDLSALK